MFIANNIFLWTYSHQTRKYVDRLIRAFGHVLLHDIPVKIAVNKCYISCLIYGYFVK